MTFLFAVSVYGIYNSKNNKSTKDYFIASNNTPWWVAMFSIVATETSVLTFVSIPGLAYRGDWFFLQLSMGYIVGRVLVAIYLLPSYFQGDIVSIYEIIGNRFGSVVQRVASSIFLTTRLFADGVRFLATAVVVQVVTGWPIWIAVLIIGIVTMVYTLSGGIKTILWIDSFQFVLYLLGGIVIVIFILNSTQFGGWYPIVEAGKINIFRLHTENMFTDAWFIGSAFFGGTLLSFASHGADYMMVQRVLTCNSLSKARLAMIGSGFFVFIQFMVFLCAGSLIWSYLGGVDIPKDRELASFIVDHLPVGLRGLLLAGVLSAAMSTLSSSINALASSTIHDWIKTSVTISKSILISGIWAILLICISLFFNEGDTAIIVIGFKIASFTYGGLLSLFLLSKSRHVFSTPILIVGLLASLSIVFFLQYLGIAWTWFIGISVLLNIIIVYTLHFIWKKVNLNKIFIISILYISCTNLFAYENGLENISKQKFAQLKNRNIGVIVNHTSVNAANKHLIELFYDAGIRVSAIFSPEHGFKGVVEAGEAIVDGIDPLTGVPIYSLYGKIKKPSKNMLKEVDLLVFDIQDIGVRYYTYVSTLTMAMDIAAEVEIPILVLDRLNPLGRNIRGPILDMQYSSFVGLHAIPIQHGMSIGELATMINEEGWLSSGNKADLTIVEYSGLINNKHMQNSFHPAPSPNMPDLETARNYTGLCLVEGTNLSEGRGTELPFKVIGAPWINNKKLLKYLLPYMSVNDQVDTISFIPQKIEGKSSHPKYKNQKCNGLRIHNLEDPIRWTVILFKVLKDLYPAEFQFLKSNYIDKLYGNSDLRITIQNKNDVYKLINEWKVQEKLFLNKSVKYRIY